MAHTNRDDIDSLIDRAAALRKAGKQREAIDVYTELIARHPVSEIYNERAVLFSDCGEFDKAVVDLSDAIGLKDDDPDYYINRGNAYLWSGAYLDAVDDYNRAIQLAPNDHYAYNGRGQALSELGRLDNAQHDFEQAIQLEPEYVSPRFNLALLLYGKEDYSAALEHLNRAIQLKPDDPAALCLRGNILAELGDDIGACDNFNRAIQIDSDCVEAHRRLCWLLSTSENQSLRSSESALLHGRKCCELTEWSDVGCLEAIAAAYASLGNFNDAIHWQSKAVSLVPAPQYDAAKSQLTAYESGRA